MGVYNVTKVEEGKKVRLDKRACVVCVCVRGKDIR